MENALFHDTQVPCAVEGTTGFRLVQGELHAVPLANLIVFPGPTNISFFLKKESSDRNTLGFASPPEIVSMPP